MHSDEAGAATLVPGQGSDLAELAAKFVVHSGGTLSPELSADLALQIVLNEIVEQACLATSGSGAAVALKSDGEVVCRASSGVTAPELGTRLDTAKGLSGLCIQTRQIQRCDDAQTDPRADAEASRLLGISSVMVLPLLSQGELVGVFEVFSSRPSAFGERDERTLEALANRILKNVEQAQQTLTLDDAKELDVSVASSDEKVGLIDSDQLAMERASKAMGGRGLDRVTLVLGLMVIACAGILGLLVGQRLGWQQGVARVNLLRGAKTTTSSVSGNGSQQNGTGGAAVSRSGPPENSAIVPTTTAEKFSTPKPARNRTAGSESSDGTLLVYENGKEVFRLPPFSADSPPVADKTGIERAASVESAASESSRAKSGQVMNLPPAAAEDSLLHRVEPNYSEEARQQGIQGPVVLEVHIAPDGVVKDLQLVSGQPLLAQSAIEAIRQWRFRPHLVNGRPVEMQTRITLNFRLPG